MHKMSLPMMKAYISICNRETRARIENLQPSELVVDKNGTDNVKIYADYFTKTKQNGGHQHKTRNVGTALSKAAVLWCREHQRKIWNADALKPNEKSHINTLVQGLIWLFFHLIARLGNLGVVHFLGANTPFFQFRLLSHAWAWYTF